MRNLEQHLTQYAAYHRDRRNIATHFVGVPLIVFSLVLALAQIPSPVLVSWIAIAAAAVYYIWLDRPLGIALTGFLVVCGLVAAMVTMLTGTWLALGLAVFIFVVGWIIQFVGHKYEGMKPAFVDDLMGLIIGPLFVTAEIFFHFRQKSELQRYIEARVGPVLAERNGRPIGPAVSAASSSSAHSAT
jgi:uncharacterized membrane protein YGL010W